MIEVYTNKHRAKIEELYLNQTFQFPFIQSTICGLQNGRIWTDNLENPTSAFICHDFGWSQLVGLSELFLKDLKNLLFVIEGFSSFKIRNFTPENSHFDIFKELSQEAQRQQFRIKDLKTKTQIPDGYSVSQIDETNAPLISENLGFDLFQRNWPSRASFNSNSFGFVIFNKSHEPVSACYSCASNYEIHEIDILTHEDHRGKGLASVACEYFIKHCKKNNLIPNWDCFTNNAGSMALAKRLGFTSHSNPYPFFTYNRQKR